MFSNLPVMYLHVAGYKKMGSNYKVVPVLYLFGYKMGVYSSKISTNI